MSQTVNAICSFLYREARLLDDRQWTSGWIFTASPWSTGYRVDDDDRLTEDPHSQISLIYYPNRNGLEDRVFRIKTERSGASTPEPRTNHAVQNVEVLEDRGDAVDAATTSTRSATATRPDEFFGTMFVTLQRHGDSFRIARKKIVLKNDYIRQVIDVYHV